MKKIRNRRLIPGVLIALLVGAMILGGCSTPAAAPAPAAPGASAPTAAAPITWTFQIHSTPTPDFAYFGPDVLINSVDVGWAKYIEAETGGRLKFKMAPVNSIFPDAESLINVEKGVVDCASTNPTYYAGTMPEAYIFGGMPFSFTTLISEYDFFFQYGFMKLVDEAMAEHNVTCLIQLREQVNNMAVNFPCNSPDDIKGKKIRVFGATAKAVEAMGGLPVTIPLSDVYMGLSLKTIDGATLGISWVESLKLQEVTKGYVVKPSMANTHGSLLINNDSLKKLPQDLQTIILNSGKYYNTVCGAEFGQQEIYLARNLEQRFKLVNYTWSEADTAKVTTLCQDKVWGDYAKASPRCAKMVEMTKTYLKLYGLIK